MRRTDQSLDEQIAEVEGRLTRRRAELRLIAAEARSRISIRKAVPVAVVAALGIGFAASRFVRKPAQPPPVRRGSRSTRLVGAIAAVVLPRLVGPLQHAATQWFSARMQQRAAAH